jgi:hypothetical protein
LAASATFPGKNQQAKYHKEQNIAETLLTPIAPFFQY